MANRNLAQKINSKVKVFIGRRIATSLKYKTYNKSEIRHQKMSITRHNYEEFFLLLADGELNQAQADAVLDFTKQHPDLADELEILMDCRLEAEVPPIFPKEKLLKPVIWNVEAPEKYQLRLLTLLDNELTDEEKTILENEIAADPLLQLEWHTLNTNAKLPYTPAAIFPKEKILKPTIWNIDEPDTIYVQMMSLLDNELSASQKQELEQKIAADKALQIEWQSLQQARLIVSATVFPNKEILYRQKEQRRIGGWMRWAAAAAVIFGFGWFLWPKANTEIPQNIAAITTKTLNSTVAEFLNKKADNLPFKGVEELVKIPSPVIAPLKETRAATQPSTAASTKKDSKNGQEKITYDDKKVLPQRNTIASNSNVNNSSSNTIAANNNADKEAEPMNAKARKIITGNSVENNEAIPPMQLSYVAANAKADNKTMLRTASFTEDADDNINPDDEVVYIAGARFNKQKVRGVFRGITRSLGRTFSKSKVEPDAEPSTITQSLLP